MFLIALLCLFEAGVWFSRKIELN